MRPNRNPLAASMTLGALVMAGCGSLHPLGATLAQQTPPGVRSAGAGAYTLISQPDGSAKAAILQAIDGAKGSIDLTMYQLFNQEVVDHLVEAGGRGVAVRVIYEPDPFYMDPENHRPVPTVTPAPAAATDLLGELGVPRDLPSPAPTPEPGSGYVSNQRAVRDLEARTAGARHPAVGVPADDQRFALTHEKSMVVDGQAAFIISNNFTNAGLGPNREYGVIDRNPAEVREVAAIFQADFQKTSYLPVQRNLVVSPDDGSGQGNSRAKLRALILSAKRSIRIEDEEFADPEMAQLLEQKVAQSQGKFDLQIMVDSSDGTKAKTWFGASGVKVVPWSPPNPNEPGKRAGLHAKLIIVDDAVAYIGSINLSFQSMGYNRELGILLADRGIVGTLVHDFTSDWTAANNGQAPKPRPVPKQST